MDRVGEDPNLRPSQYILMTRLNLETAVTQVSQCYPQKQSATDREIPKPATISAQIVCCAKEMMSRDCLQTR